MRFVLVIIYKNMTTLELVSNSPHYRFKSLGVYNPITDAFEASNDFPTDTEYVLTAGKFPLTDYNDLFIESNKYHTLDKNIEVKITGFDNSCQEGQINEYGSCKITVEKKEAATENPESIRIDSSHSLRNGPRFDEGEATEKPERMRIDSSHSFRNGPRVDEGEVVNPLHGLGKRKSRRNRKTKKSRKSKTRKNGRKSNRRR
jgi:hypothetical protein